jgi:DNA-binding response OmpR family regulator
MHTVLVVEHEPSISELWTRTLQDAGYRVVTAADSAQVVRRLADGNPTVAICDVHLPGAGGLQLPELIRQHCRTTAIVLAATDGVLPPFDTLRPAVFGYLLKPVGRDELLEAVAAAIRWSTRHAPRWK